MARVERETIRRLAELHVEEGRMLSVYVNLDPSWFGTAPARSTAVRSVVDAAAREVREAGDGLQHDARQALRSDVDRVKEFLQRVELDGAQALAVFSASVSGVFETLKLPRPVENEVVVGTSPYVEPLVELAPVGEWLVLLANRRVARILRGGADGLLELGRFEDQVHGRHDQGGWSQANYQRSIDKDAMHHLKRSAEAAHRHYRRWPFDHLLLGSPEESYAAVEEQLHPELRHRLRGRVELDVGHSTPAQVHEAVRPLIERHERERTDELLARLQEGLGKDERAAAGLGPVVEALNEQRVEALLVENGFTAAGVECPKCGWLGATDGITSCPADGTELRPRPDLIEAAVERALHQDAEVVRLRDRPELGPHGRVAAVLRF